MEAGELEFFADDDSIGERLDSVLTRLLAEDTSRRYSRTQISRWIGEGCVLVDAEVVLKPSFRLRTAATISIEIPEERVSECRADPNVALDIVFEDGDLLVLNKPAGIVVHPGAGREEQSLLAGLLHYLGPHLQLIGDSKRPGLVHRLDKDTAGLLVVAKSELAYRQLVEQFLPPRTISREYRALCRKVPKQPSMTAARAGSIDLPIGRDPQQRLRMAVRTQGGKPSVTHWEIERELTHGVLLKVTLESGRTHQIRVHLAAVGAPIVGDPLYGEASGALPIVIRKAVAAFGHQALVATTLSFIHPRHQQRVSFQAELPGDFQTLLEVFA